MSALFAADLPHRLKLRDEEARKHSVADELGTPVQAFSVIEALLNWKINSSRASDDVLIFFMKFNFWLAMRRPSITLMTISSEKITGPKLEV
ncbi:hypothetical protein ABKV19_000800 [Rosa sericea]